MNDYSKLQIKGQNWFCKESRQLKWRKKGGGMLYFENRIRNIMIYGIIESVKNSDNFFNKTRCSGVGDKPGERFRRRMSDHTPFAAVLCRFEGRPTSPWPFDRVLSELGEGKMSVNNGF